MRYSIGNAKLGEGCFVVSRPVGDSCPSSCEFLGNGCYSQATERVYTSSRAVGLANMVTAKNTIRAMILEAARLGKSIRWHERGDWFKDGALDVEYVDNVTWACESIVKSRKELPDMWFYTHVYDVRLAALSKYMSVYASVHNAEDKAQAVTAGFTLFAWCDSTQEHTAKRPHHTAKAKNANWRASLPKLVIIDDTKYVVCPEIRRGRGVVTCTPSKDSVTCELCTRGLANVFFPNH